MEPVDHRVHRDPSGGVRRAACAASPLSTWSVDLAAERVTYSACKYPYFANDSRALTALELNQLRVALEDVWLSRQTSCGFDQSS